MRTGKQVRQYTLLNLGADFFLAKEKWPILTKRIEEILERLQSGKLKIRHEIEDLKIVTNRLVSGMLIASLFMGSSLLLSQQLPPLVGGFSLFGIAGCLTAIVLGGRLLWRTR